MTQRRGIFVTGTDTGVGKTLVSCSIVSALRARGISVGVFKPSETGCESRGGRFEAADAAKLVAAAGGAQPIESATGPLFEMPAAPMVAAEAAGVHIDPLALVAGFQRTAARHEFVVVEGAGGLLVPIADGCTFLDLARMLSLPVLCVVGSRLGCINHALLTLRALQTSGVPCAGYVLNEICGQSDGSPTTDSNRAAIRRFTGQKDLGVLPYVSESQRENWDELGALAERNLDLDRLLALSA